MTKHLLAAFATAAALALCGCADFRERITEPVVPAQPQVRSFAADAPAVFAAARKGAAEMGYRVTRGGANQGFLEAVSGVSEGDIPQSSRQATLKARFEPSPDGGTQVSVSVNELVAEENGGHVAMPGSTASNSLGDSPIAETFFRLIQKNLGGVPAEKQ